MIRYVLTGLLFFLLCINSLALTADQLEGTISFTTPGKEGYDELFLLGDERDAPERLNVMKGYYSPSISPDGTRIVFTTDGKRQLFIVGVKSKELRKVAQSDKPVFSNLCWSPDQKKIFSYRLGYGAHLIDVMSGVVDSLNFYRIIEERPSFLPDGRLVLINKGGDISVYDFDTGQSKRLTGVPAGGQYTALDISPAGDIIALIYHNYLTEQSEIRVLDLKTGSVKNIFTAPWITYISWSPDGRYIAFTGQAEKSKGLHLLTDQGQYLRQLVPEIRNFNSLGWGGEGSVGVWQDSAPLTGREDYSQETQEKDLKHFTGEYFAIDYPPSWEYRVERLKDGDLVRFFVPEQRTMLTLFLYKEMSQFGVEGFNELFNALYQKYKKDPRINPLKKEQIDIEGNWGYKVLYEDINDQERYIDLYLHNKNQLLIVNYMAGDAENNKLIIERVLTSLKFKE